MPLEDFMIYVFCCVEELMSEVCNRLKIRQRGFAPKLSDSEVITIEIIGEFLGLDTDKKIWEYFLQHWKPWFPKLPCRTTFVRQAANLLSIKLMLQKQLALRLGAFDDSLHVVDGFPIPVCHFARARRGKLFKGEAGYGRCTAKRQVYFGFKGHLLVSGSGVITSLIVTSANIEEHNVVEDLSEGIQGLLIGDKGYISAALKERLQENHVDLQTPLRKNMHDERSPQLVSKIKSIRRIVETVISQLDECLNLGIVWARDGWHLMARIARKVFAHTVGAFLNKQLNRPIIKFSGLIKTV